jgi:hypothetical protein
MTLVMTTCPVISRELEILQHLNATLTLIVSNFVKCPTSEPEGLFIIISCENFC